MPARRWNTSLAERSPPVGRSSSAPALSGSGSLRHSHSGTSASGTAVRRAAMPALRKYFWARTSQATCDQPAGTSTSCCANTTEPSGLRISHEVVRYATSSRGDPFSVV